MQRNAMIAKGVGAKRATMQRIATTAQSGKVENNKPLPVMFASLHDTGCLHVCVQNSQAQCNPFPG
jgi:hypothetical protein